VRELWAIRFAIIRFAASSQLRVAAINGGKIALHPPNIEIFVNNGQNFSGKADHFWAEVVITKGEFLLALPSVYR